MENEHLETAKRLLEGATDITRQLSAADQQALALTAIGHALVGIAELLIMGLEE